MQQKKPPRSQKHYTRALTSPTRTTCNNRDGWWVILHTRSAITCELCLHTSTAATCYTHLKEIFGSSSHSEPVARGMHSCVSRTPQSRGRYCHRKVNNNKKSKQNRITKTKTSKRNIHSRTHNSRNWKAWREKPTQASKQKQRIHHTQNAKKLKIKKIRI